MAGTLVGKARAAVQTAAIMSSDLVHVAALCSGSRRLQRVARALERFERRLR